MLNKKKKIHKNRLKSNLFFYKEKKHIYKYII